jgi:cobalt/nickel transport system ATP-binding protein
MSEVAVQIARLGYTYPDGSAALDGVDLEVRRGERVGLVGPSGAGKSTLLLHLNGVLTGSGSVRILDRAVSGGELREIRRRVGLVFQNPDDQLFCPTVFDDVAFGPLNLGVPPAEVPARVERTLASVGLDGSFRGRSSHHLSQGERKRVALAAVLVMAPEVLALDEPTSNLDPRNRRQLLELIQGLEATLLVATHDLEMVLALCERTVVLDRGRIWADGPTRKILGDAALLDAHGLEVPLTLRLRSSRE